MPDEQYFQQPKLDCKDRLIITYEALSRLQTLFIAAVLFGVETDHLCVVPNDSQVPLDYNTSHEMFGHDVSNDSIRTLLHNERWNISKIFEIILVVMLLVSSLGTIIVYYKIYLQV